MNGKDDKKKFKKKQQSTIQSVRDWLTQADWDYGSARKLFLSGSPLFWFSASMLAHQALEKYLKTILLSYGAHVSPKSIWGHGLTELARRCTDMSLGEKPIRAVFFSTEFYGALKKFDGYFEELRYPTKLEQVEGLGLEELRLLDNLVSVIRPQINFARERLPATFREMWAGDDAVDSQFVAAAEKENQFWGSF